MEIETYVEGRLERKLAYWRQQEKTAVIRIFLFLLIGLVSFYLDYLFFPAIIFIISFYSLLLIYSFQRVLVLNNIKGHTWDNT